jgi:hypothetical protein
LDENQFDLRTFGSVSMFLNLSSWDSSCKEDTNLIPKRKILGDPKLAMVFVERMRLNALPNNLKTF